MAKITLARAFVLRGFFRKTVMNETMSSKFLIIANNIFNEFVKTL